MLNQMKTLFRRKIGLKDAGLFAYSMAVCLKAGLSTVESLRLAGNKHTGKINDSAQEIVVSVEKGNTLFEAFNKQCSLWPLFFHKGDSLRGSKRKIGRDISLPCPVCSTHTSGEREHPENLVLSAGHHHFRSGVAIRTFRFFPRFEITLFSFNICIYH